MSTQPEPQTKAGRELLDRQSDPDWMDLDYAPKLAAILAIEAQATAAARAEVARLIEDGIEAFRLTREYVGEDTLPAIEGWSWFDWCEHAKAVLEDAAPRQPEPTYERGFQDGLAEARGVPPPTLRADRCWNQACGVHDRHPAAPDTTTEADR